MTDGALSNGGSFVFVRAWYDDRAMKLLVCCVVLSTACDRPTQPAPASAGPSATPSVSALVSAPSASASASASTAAPITPGVTFNSDPLGAPSPSFEAVVGDWYVAELASTRGLQVDGGKWRKGTPSVGLADKAKELHGDRYAEELDGVKAFAFYPLAVHRDPPPKGDVRISVRFYPLAGKVDQAAGIAFGIAPDGSYHGVRANALEDNLLYFTVTKGKRTVVDTIRGVSTPTKTWHTLAIELQGSHLNVFLDDKRSFERLLDKPPAGRVGIWSKADSEVLFDDFTVAAL